MRERERERERESTASGCDVMYLGLLLDLLLRPKEWLPCTTIECTPTHARSELVSISLSLSRFNNDCSRGKMSRTRSLVHSRRRIVA